jgi:hypothetical protein
MYAAIMGSTAEAALGVPWQGLAERPEPRTLDALMTAWRRRSSALPQGVLVSIFADIIAQANEEGTGLSLEPRDVFVDLHGIAKIAVPEGRRVFVAEIVGLIERVLGQKPPFDESEHLTRAHVASWIYAKLGAAAPRDRVLLAFDASRWHEVLAPLPREKRSSSTAKLVPDTVFGMRPPIRHTLSRPLHPVTVKFAPAARPGSRPASHRPIAVGPDRRRWARLIVILAAIAGSCWAVVAYLD